MIIEITLAILFLMFVASYNSLVRLRGRAKEAWADIDVQLKRRYNLIPNLVETVKGYVGYEKEIFERIANARAMAMGAKNIQEKQTAENDLTKTLKTLFSVAEAYPELKSSQNFMNLQEETRDTEDKIQAARRFYNSNVRDFNIKIESFPINLISSFFGFKKFDFFKLETKEERENPKIGF